MLLLITFFFRFFGFSAFFFHFLEFCGSRLHDRMRSVFFLNQRLCQWVSVLATKSGDVSVGMQKGFQVKEPWSSNGFPPF